MANKTLIIGVGNAFRGDDVAGLEVARRLGAMDLPGITVLEQSGDGSALLDAWQDADRVILVDAAVSGAEPGYVHRLEVGRDPLPAGLFRSVSSHAFGVAEAIRLAEELGRLPGKLTVYAIEGKRFGHGEHLSLEVATAVSEAAVAIRQELGQRLARVISAEEAPLRRKRR